MFVVSQIRATWPSHYTLLHLTIPIYYTASRPILNKVTYYVYTKMTNKMQLCKIIYYSMSALHVSSDIFAHHQEHPNCITASGITHVCRCRLVSWECWNCKDLCVR